MSPAASPLVPHTGVCHRSGSVLTTAASDVGRTGAAVPAGHDVLFSPAAGAGTAEGLW
jgi:hypothetical protein